MRASASQVPHAEPAELPLAGGRQDATLTLHPLLCGEMRGPIGWFERAAGPGASCKALGLGVPAEQIISVPIIAFLLEHPTAGPVLIDTGFHRSIAGDSRLRRTRNLGLVGRLISRDIQLRPEQTAAAQLQALGIAPADVGLIVMTHLHFDHASALSDFPGATVLVSEPEWRSARTRGSSLRGYSAAQLDPRPSYRTVDLTAAGLPARGPFERALDVFADGSLTLVPTPGHSAGHLSVIARLSEREALIAGDAIYTMATLRDGERPFRSEDPEAFERSLQTLQAYDRAHPDALIIPGHDMAHWRTLESRYV
jgi:N-acyl homoserine lactone hydrolase